MEIRTLGAALFHATRRTDDTTQSSLLLYAILQRLLKLDQKGTN